VLALTKSIAIDYAKQGVRANAVLPCDITMPMFSRFQMPEGGDWELVKRVMAPRGSGVPSDVAGVVAMLASDDGAHVTGAANLEETELLTTESQRHRAEKAESMGHGDSSTSSAISPMGFRNGQTAASLPIPLCVSVSLW
jgi:hypothetical protein